jgi:hypothetical protein
MAYNYLQSVRFFPVYPTGSLNAPSDGTPATQGFYGWGPFSVGTVAQGLPHGPLFVRYWTTTNPPTTSGPYYSEPAVDEWEKFIYVSQNRIVSGPYYLSCEPAFFTDAITHQVYVNLTGLLDISLGGSGTGPAVAGGVGIWNAGIIGTAANVQAKYASGLFPAFDMSDTWYAQLASSSTIAGVASAYTLSTFLPVNAFGINEYKPLDGFTLASQSASSRVWQRVTATGTDVVAITLSTPTSPAPTPAAGVTVLPLGQVFISGPSTWTAPLSSFPNTTSTTVESLGTSSTYPTDAGGPPLPAVPPPPPDTQTYPSVGGTMIVLNADGTMSLPGVTIPGGSYTAPAGSGSFTGSGGKIPPGTLTAPGAIILYVGLWDGPVSGAFGGLGGDLVAEV